MKETTKQLIEKINRPLSALKRSGFALLRSMPTIGERLFGWLDELESTDELKELLVGFDELPLQDKTARLRDFIELWELFTNSSVAIKAHSTPPPKKVEEITEAAPTSFDELTERDITYEKGVGPARAKLLARLGIGSVAELLLHLPRDYQDRRRLTKIARLKVGEQAAVVGELTNLENRRSKRGSRLLGLLSDGTGSVMLTWFNATYLSKILRVGTKLVAFGKVTLYNGPQLINPEFEVVRSTDDPLAAGRVVPFYRLTEGLGMGFMRHLQRRVLDRYLPQLKDYLPEAIRQEQGLQTLAETFEQVHFPQDTDSPLKARRRLAFDGLLLLQLAVLRERQRLDKYTGAEILCEGELPRRLVEKLPFELTAAQQRALERIRGDLNLSRPMNRLLQGDVGSGKTLVALLAMLCAVEAGFQAVLMAPTEVLARQHHHTVSKLLAPLGVPCHLLTGSLKSRPRLLAVEAAAAGESGITIGTTALIQDKVNFSHLGLVVVDEQHRFGVAQRSRLAAASINLLVMTATPIPRSLALTVYGDLDSTVLDEMPPGRQPVKTHLLKMNRADKAWEFVRKEAEARRQSFVICPLVEESDGRRLSAATQRYEELSRNELSGLRLGLVHGRLDSVEKNEVMRRFAAGELDVLVATTVVEVGVDIPNATVMVIEEAQQFGLAQLHQLRGRIGRGEYPSRCYLLTGDKPTDIAKQRLKAMTKTTDGFELAALDLRLRGPGELLGTKQHGLPDVALQGLLDDRRLLESAREVAAALLKQSPELDKYPGLQQRLQTIYGESIPKLSG